MKEDKEASNLKLTADHDLHNGLAMVTSVSKFSDSSFTPWAWGICRESRYTHLGVKVGTKRSKNLPNTENNHTQVKMGK